MINIAQISGTNLSSLAVVESTFETQTQLGFELFEYDGADWNALSHSGAVDLADYGITFSGTPAQGNVIGVYQDQIFVAGKGINCIKLNENLAALQSLSNANESAINDIEANALLKDGSNVTQTMVDAFNTVTPVVLTNQSGTIALQDNTPYYISLSGDATISLPAVPSDSISHTITMVVEGSAYSLDLGTTKTLGSLLAIEPNQAYQVMYIYNKIDNQWYYSLGQ